MKKFTFLALTFILCVSLLSVPAFAAGEASSPANYGTLSAEELAYCDLAASPAEWQDNILAARENIIYSHSWTVDGQCKLIHPDGTVEELPEFYDLFPADWDIPSSAAETTASAQYASRIHFSGYISLNSRTPVLARPFYTFTGNGSSVTMELSDLPGSSCNMGFTNLTLNQDVGYVVNQPSGSRYTISPTSPTYTYGARASTDSSTGRAYANVWG